MPVLPQHGCVQGKAIRSGMQKNGQKIFSDFPAEGFGHEPDAFCCAGAGGECVGGCEGHETFELLHYWCCIKNIVFDNIGDGLFLGFLLQLRRTIHI